MLSLLIFMLLVFVGVLVWLGSRASIKFHGSSTNASQTRSFHSVLIRYGEDACGPVKELEGIRFLSNEAPSIPLPACDAAHCGCSYLHFEDRRRGERRHPWSMTPGFMILDRRSGRDACESVKKLRHKRFLPAEAPSLPLPGCDAVRCHCRYAHFDDRRQEARPSPMKANFLSGLKNIQRARGFHCVSIQYERDRRRSRAMQ